MNAHEMAADAIALHAEAEAALIAERRRAETALAEVERLRRRVAQLEAERPNRFREEFGIRWDGDPEIEHVTTYAAAGRLARAIGGGTVVRREVRQLATAWKAC